MTQGVSFLVIDFHLDALEAVDSVGTSVRASHDRKSKVRPLFQSSAHVRMARDDDGAIAPKRLVSRASNHSGAVSVSSTRYSGLLRVKMFAHSSN